MRRETDRKVDRQRWVPVEARRERAVRQDEAMVLLEHLARTGPGGEGLMAIAVRGLVAEGVLDSSGLWEAYIRAASLMGEERATRVFLGDGVSVDVEGAIRAILDDARGSGEEREEETARQAAEMASRLGLDPDGVEVRMGEEGERRARAAGAMAVEQGRVIYLDQRRVDPRTKEGREVLGHEVTHVAQVERGTIPARLQDAEVEADFVGTALAENRPVEAPRVALVSSTTAASQESKTGTQERQVPEPPNRRPRVISPRNPAPSQATLEVSNEDRCSVVQKVLFPTIMFNLDSMDPIVVDMGSAVFVYRYGGSIKVQRAGTVNPLTFDPEGYSIEARRVLCGVLTQTIGLRMSNDGVSIKFGMENEWHSSSWMILGPRSFRATFSPRSMKSRIMDWVIVGDVSLVIDIHLKDPGSGAVLQPVPEGIKPETIPTVAILAAVALIVGTLVEDVLTAGVGVADDVPSFAAACALLGIPVSRFW